MIRLTLCLRSVPSLALVWSCSPTMTSKPPAFLPAVQCAAVMMYLEQRIVPPQKGVGTYSSVGTIATCQGIEFAATALPPTILSSKASNKGLPVRGKISMLIYSIIMLPFNSPSVTTRGPSNAMAKAARALMFKSEKDLLGSKQYEMYRARTFR